MEVFLHAFLTLALLVVARLWPTSLLGSLKERKALVTRWARCWVGLRSGLMDTYGREICCSCGKSNRNCLIAKPVVYSLYRVIQKKSKKETYTFHL
jgi:hypothetical protein